jgi:hypothetical protein
MCALAQVLDRRYRPIHDRDGARNPRLDEIVLLSVGSGLSLTFLEEPRVGRWGLGWGAIPWSLPVAGNIVKLVTDGTVGIAHYQCRQLLREQYHRFEPTFDAHIDIGIDSIKDLPYMKAFARAWQPTVDDVNWLTGRWASQPVVAASLPSGGNLELL